MCDVQIDAVNADSKSKGSGNLIEWRVDWFSRDLGGVEALVGSVGYASLVQSCLPFATSGLRSGQKGSSSWYCASRESLVLCDSAP